MHKPQDKEGGRYATESRPPSLTHIGLRGYVRFSDLTAFNGKTGVL